MPQFFWPRASFWRPWLVALALSAVALFVFINLGHAGEYRRHHHHTRHHHRLARAPSISARAMMLERAHRFQDARVIGGDNISIALHFLGSGNPTSTRGPWCADFLNLVEHLAGRPGIRSRMAIDWRGYGRPSGPVPGAIAVFRGHVALVMQRVGDRIRIISGNWAHRVGIGWASVRSAVAFRYP